MDCAYCREPLLEGATVCRCCARSQPLTPKMRKVRAAQLRKRLKIWIPAGLGGVVLLGIIWGVFEAQHQNELFERAAACSGISAGVLKATAEKAAADGRMSLSNANYLAIGLACPRLLR